MVGLKITTKNTFVKKETKSSNHYKPKMNKNSLRITLNAEFFPMHMPQGSMVKLCRANSAG